MNFNPALSRRAALGCALAAVSGAGELLTPADASAADAAAVAGDFAFLMGSWRIQHRKLKSRLTGESGWWDFSGTARAWPLMNGQGNIDDNVLNDPNGVYRAVSLRHFDARTRQWSIWWLDERTTVLDPPVIGSFKDGVGIFTGDDTLRGMPIRVRFIWSQITPHSARWEQAFSPDAGASWEVNWIMNLTRQA